MMDGALIAQTLPGRPMTTHHALEVGVGLPASALQAAAAHLARACEALRTVVLQRRLRFIRRVHPFDEATAASRVCFAASTVARSGWLDLPFDLSREWPFRIRCAPTPEGRVELVFTLHHSVTDGRGALVLFDWFLRAALAAREGGPLPPSPLEEGPTPTLARVLRREGSRFALTLARNVGVSANRFWRHRASLLESAHLKPESTGLRVETLEPELWGALKVAASARGCTRNDLLWCAALRAADALLRERGAPPLPFRLVGGVDLRDFFGAQRALRNWVGTLEADFTPEEVRGPALERCVHERLLAARQPAQALVTPVLMSVLGTLLPPAAFRELFRWTDEDAKPFMYSLLLSHIRPREQLCWPRALEPHRLWCASTLPRKPGLGVTVTTVGERVSLALCWPRPLASDAWIGRFVALLRQALARSSGVTHGARAAV